MNDDQSGHSSRILASRILEAASFGGRRHVYIFENGRFSARPSWTAPAPCAPADGPVPPDVARG